MKFGIGVLLYQSKPNDCADHHKSLGWFKFPIMIICYTTTTVLSSRDCLNSLY